MTAATPGEGSAPSEGENGSRTPDGVKGPGPIFSSPQADRRTLFVMLAAVVLAGAYLRFHGLDRQSLWLDELASVEVASRPTLATVVTEGLRRDVHPPLYFLLLHLVVKAFGNSEFALRALSAAAGVLSIPLVFLLGRKLYDEETGLFASALTAALWYPIYYSQEARPYSLLMLLALASSWYWMSVMEGLSREGRLRWGAAAGYAAAALACAYTHYFGVLLVAFQGVAAGVWLAARRPRSLGRLALIYAAVALGYAPWFAQALRTARSDAGWIPKPSAYILSACFRWFFNVSAVVNLCALGLYAWLAVRDIRETLRRGGGKEGAGAPSWAFKDLVLGLWLIVPFAAATGISVVRTPIVWPRFFVICAPAAWLLAARGIRALPLRKDSRATVAGIAVILLLGHLIMGKQYYSAPHKEQFREAVALVVENDAAYRDSLIIAGGGSPAFFNYYFARLGSDRRVDVEGGREKDIPAISRMIAERRPRYIWFLCAHGQPEPAFLDYLRRRFTARNAKEFYDAAVLLLENRPPAKGPSE